MMASLSDKNVPEQYARSSIPDAAICQSLRCRVIATSSDAADHYDKYLNNGADYVISGEAEYTLLENDAAIGKNISPLENIKGLIYQQQVL